MTRRVQIAVCGFGGAATYFHLPLIQQNPHLELVAVFEPNEERRGLARESCCATTLPPDSLGDDIRRMGIDLVVICSPSSLHMMQTEIALSAGAAVIVDKPATGSAGEYRRLISMASRRNSFVIPFHNRQFDDDHKKIVDLVRLGRIGNLLRIELSHAQWQPSEQFAAREFLPSWRRMKSWGGGMLYDWGPHLFDQLLRLAEGRQPDLVRVLGGASLWSSDVDDFTDVLLAWKGGLYGRVMMSAIDHDEYPRARIIGTTGSITVSGTDECGDVVIADGAGTERLSYQNSLEHAGALYQAAADAIVASAPLLARRFQAEADGVYLLLGKVASQLTESASALQEKSSLRRPLRSKSSPSIHEVSCAETWDELVDNAHGATVFHATRWLGHSTFDFHRIGLFEGDRLQAAAVVQCAKEPFGHLGTLSPYLGPFVRSAVEADASSAQWRRRVHDLSVYIKSNIQNACYFTSPYFPDVSSIVSAGFNAIALYTRLVHIDDLDRTWSNLASVVQRNIRAAERAGYSVHTGTLDALLMLSQRSFSRQGIEPWYDVREVTSCVESLLVKEQSAIFETKSPEGRIVAAVCIVWDTRRAYYILGGYDHEASHRGATSLALWHAMSFASREIGIDIFDLEGSSIPQIARYFDQWTACRRPFYFVRPSGTLPFLE